MTTEFKSYKEVFDMVADYKDDDGLHGYNSYHLLQKLKISLCPSAVPTKEQDRVLLLDL